MPIYDYRCNECGNEVEVVHGIHGAGPTECGVCGGTMRKALSAPAIHFKGSGWAKKDARSAAKKATTANKGNGTSKDGSTPSDSPAPAGSDDKKTEKATTTEAKAGANSDSGTTASTSG